MIRIGTSFQKARKNAKEDPGHFVAVSFADSPFDFLSDILGKQNNFTWSVVDDRVVVWVQLRFLREDSLKALLKQPKSRTKTKSIVQEDSRPRLSPETSAIVKSEFDRGPIELINLSGFPQDGPPSDSDVSEVRQGSDPQPDHEDPHLAEEDEAGRAEAQNTNQGDGNSQTAHQPSRKRPRAPTRDSDDEPIRPRRSQREVRLTSKARLSRP